MLALIQLVSHAQVDVDQKTVGKIDQGIMALIGIEKTDTEDNAARILERIIHYRIFRDADGKTNLSLREVNGGLLLVPQFTLVADTKKGTRPGFSKGMPPAEGKILFEKMVSHAKTIFPKTESGVFGAHMQVGLCNDGPVTFMLQS